jgi:hypothetical protein
MKLVARLLSALAAVALSLGASASDLPEYRLKAAFLFNFALFTEWPAEVGPTLNVCVHGQDPFGDELDALNGRAVGQRRVAVNRKPRIDGLKDCQLVFIAGSAISGLPRVLEALRGLPVLTVADSPGAARDGVVLNMAVAQSKIVFDANLEAARAARVTLSSKMLRLAREVYQ